MKRKILGIPITLFIVGILFIGGASAALVGYISNKVTAEIEVSSPMVAGISTGEGAVVDWATAQCLRSGTYQNGTPYGMLDCYPAESHTLDDWEMTETPITLLNSEGNPVKGGESVTLYIMTENTANVKTYGHEEIRVANPDGVSCLDFVSSCRFDGNIYGDNGYGKQYYDCNSIPECHNINPNLIELWSADDTSSWDAGETEVAQWILYFETDATGTYTLTYQVIPAI